MSSLVFAFSASLIESVIDRLAAAASISDVFVGSVTIPRSDAIGESSGIELKAA
jgi:hypothetical protein